MSMSCAIRPSEEDLANADYGPYPVEHEEIIKAHMSGVLKDPYSARYEFFGPPTSGWQGVGSGRRFGWRICATINAKNSYGGYTGAKLYYFMIRYGQVVKRIGGGDQYAQASARGACDS